MGIEPARFRLEWISASEAERVKTVVNEMVEQVRALGPLHVVAPEDVPVPHLREEVAA